MKVLGIRYRGLVIGLAFIATVALAQERNFRVAEPGYEFAFPRDHGSHPDFKIEWWYLTGHLETADGGQRFGFQATFFRNALARPGEEKGGPAAVFGDDQVYLAHMALLDAETGAYIYEERLNREGWDAGAMVEDLHVHNGNWSLVREPGSEAGTGERMRLHGSVRSEARFELEMAPLKPRVIFGVDGISRKAADPSAASHYITFSRLEAKGSVRWGEHTHSVSGTAWMDHEISSSQLGADQVGWNWASIQLDDGREIMAYVMRTASGEVDPFSTLAWISKEGKVAHFSREQFRWEEGRRWTSAKTGTTYPIESVIRTVDPEKGEERTFRLVPVADAQELAGELGGVGYWEGACDVLDANGDTVGKAFVELTGYDGRLRARLQ